jgi:hypothetical protein
VRNFRTRICLIVAAFCLSFNSSGQAQVSKGGSAPKAGEASVSMPSAGEIANAKAKGLVWTNPTTKVYHKDGEFYGKTKNGKFMSEADAVKQYYRPAPDASRKGPSTKADAPKAATTAAASAPAKTAPPVKAPAPPPAKKK